VKPLCQIYCEAERISDANQPCKPALTTQVRQQLIEVYREDIWRLQNLSSGIFKLGRARECYRSPAKVIMLVKPNGCLSGIVNLTRTWQV